MQIAALIPPILTCLLGRHLGQASATPSLPTYPLRRLSASLLAKICARYSASSHTLKPRLARSCLKNFLDPTKPLATTYGAVVGLTAIGGADVVRGLILPNLKAVDELVLKETLATPAAVSQNGVGSTAVAQGTKRAEAEMLCVALIDALNKLVDTSVTSGATAGRGAGEAMDGLTNGHAAETKERLTEKVGGVLADRLLDGSGAMRVVNAVLEEA